MAVDVGSAVGYLDLDISGFLSNLRTAQSEANNVSNNIVTKFGNNISGIGSKMSSVGSTLTKTVTTPVAGAGAAIIKMSSDFESAMSKVSAISGATGDDLDALNLKAQEMGAKTKFSATESAEAFTYMAMAGWKTEDMLEGIDGIMSLAAADGLDLATTSDIVTDALTAFGLSASDSGHFADVLAKAASNANTNVSLLGESFKYAAPVAGALGYSAEDTAIALGLMANAGIKGSQGGTALRASISRLVKPTDDVATAMDKYNISLTNSDGSMKSLGEVMENLRTNLGDLSEAEQAQAAATLFGQEAMSGMLAIINSSESDYDKLTNAIYNADGAAKQMADTMIDNLAGQITLLKSALEGLAIQFGEIMMPYIKQFVEWLQNLTQKLQEMTPEQKEQVIRWAAMAAAIGPVLLVIGKLVTSVGNIITTFGKLPGAITAVKTGFTTMVTSVKHIGEAYTLAKAGMTGFAAQTSTLGTALAGITAPIAAVIAIIGVLVAAVITLWKTNEDFRNNIIAIWNRITESLRNFFDGIIERLNALGFNFESITEVISTIWKGFCDLLAPVFEGAFGIIASILETVLGVLTGLLDVFIGYFTGDWDQFCKGIEGIFTSCLNGLISILQNLGNTLFGIFNAICKWFGTTWSETWNKIKQFFSTVLNNMISSITTWASNMKSKATQAASNMYNAIVNGLASLPSKLLSIGKNIVQGLWNGIQNAKSWLISKVSGLAKSVLNGFKSAFGIHSPSTEMEEQGGYMMEGLGLGMESGLSQIFTFISSMFDSVMQRMSSLVDSISGIFSGNMFGDTDTKALDKYNMTLMNTLNLCKQLAEQMKMCVQYSNSFSVDGSGLISLGMGTPDIMSILSKFKDKDVDLSGMLGGGSEKSSTQGEQRKETNNEGKPDTLVIPITIGDEQIENVVVDLLRREVRT